MKKIYLLPVALAAVLLCSIAGCSREDCTPPQEAQTEIRLTTGIQLRSRASFPEADVQIPEGEMVSVWIDQVGDEVTPLYDENRLEAGGDGTLLAGGKKMYFPLNGNNVNIYALHTNATWTGEAYPTATMTHTVNAMQKTRADYAASDLLYGRAMNIARTKEAVPLTFYHLLSKLQVAICPVEGLTAADIQRVTIGGTRRQANITLTKTSAPNALNVLPAGTASPVELGTDASTDFTDANVRYNDAIVVPQRVTAGTVFITITLTSGEDIVYRLTSDINFESGKRYSCHMTVNMTGIQLKTSVSDWKPGDLITGNNGIVHYVVNYTDNTSETVYAETMGTVDFNGSGKTVRSIDLPDLGKSYLIGRSNLTSLTLNLDDNGDLRFRPSVDGYTPIGSYAELQLINTFPGAMAGHYKQEADLDLMGEEWTPVGDGTTTKFSGKYDGSDFKINRLKIEKASGNVGLFGYIDGTYADILNVHIASGTIAVKDSKTGGICGYSNGGNIVHCSNAAQVSNSSQNIYSYSGGIVGYNEGDVANCSNIGTIFAGSYSLSPYSGGIAGYNTTGCTVTACCNTGTVSSISSYSSYSGGIAGYNNNSCTLTACYNNGTVSSSSKNNPSYSGGITGYNSMTCIVTACYNTGTVSSTSSSYSGGIAGYNNNSCTVMACYWKTGTGMPSKGVGTDYGTSAGLISFTDTFTPDASAYPQWELGSGTTNGWWKNYNGNNNLPQLWWEK